MDSPRPLQARGPGKGLAACALAVVVLTMLAATAARRPAPAEPLVADAEPALFPKASPESDAPRELAPWPPAGAELGPPIYEAPYGGAPDADPLLPPIALPPVDDQQPVDPPADKPLWIDPATPLVDTGPDGVGEELPADGPPVYESPVAGPSTFEFPELQDTIPSDGVEDDELAPLPPPAAEPYASTPVFGPPSSDPPGEWAAVEPITQTPSALAEPSEEGAPAAADDADPEAVRAGAAPLDELLVDTPAPTEVSRLLATDVRAGFTLGRHGALFAARSRFIAVLREVALAKDAERATDRHSQALAAGLKALDEALAFVPRGAALDADLDVCAIAASHDTPLFKESSDPAWVAPQEALARYHRYAQHKLAVVAAGDQAGSMALHGLGKTYARLADLDEAPLADRTSLTMYRAAVEAHGGNYLAANELGVGLAKAGRHRAAEQAFVKAIGNGGSSTVYRNLAVVEQKLGRPEQAAAAQARAEQLASAERAAGAFSREQGVQWVDPREFSRVADAYNRQATPSTASRSEPANWQTPNNRTVAPARSQTIVR